MKSEKKDSLEQLNQLWAQYEIITPSNSLVSLGATMQLANLFSPGRSFFLTIDFTILDVDFVSDNIEECTGIPKEDFNLERWLQTWHKSDYDIVSKMEYCKGLFLFEFIPPEEIIHYKICQTYRLLQPDGKYRDFLNQISTLILTEDNKIQKTLLVQTDITHLSITQNHRLSFIHMKGGKSYYSDDLENFVEYGENLTVFSKREQDILKLISNGMSSQQIADQLFISKNTVDTHRRNILNKVDSDNMIEVVSDAIRNGWI